MKCKPLAWIFLAAQTDKSLGTLFEAFGLVGNHIVKNCKHRELCYCILTMGLASSVGPSLRPDSCEINVCLDSLGSEIPYFLP